MARTLSAKDKAFMEEKTKLKKQHREQVAELGARILTLDKENKELKDKVQKMEKLIAEYEKHSSMSADEFAEHVARERKCSESMEVLMSLPNAMGFGLYR